ncbi:hypothetical protein ACFE04_029470 [Oxalis oulophora]
MATTSTTTTTTTNNTLCNNLFSSLVSEIKSYNGKDPLLPWLRGIKKMKESLPPKTLNEKLPRFLQKCVQAFETDLRYRNDLRFLRVWLQLMDFVDDPRAVLRTMEANKIGVKKSLFYQAYALYYEKVKNFEDAEKMYYLGVQNLAEPADELQKSYDQFLNRMEKHRKKKIQRQDRVTSKRSMSATDVTLRCTETKKSIEEGSKTDSADLCTNNETRKSLNKQPEVSKKSDKSRMFCGENTMVAKFVDTAIVGKSEAEDVCHHGLVDPTINMKDAMNDINRMFRDPIETVPARKRTIKTQQKENNQHLCSGFEVFVDENLDDGNKNQTFEIFVDDGNSSENNKNYVEDNLENSGAQISGEGSSSSTSRPFFFPCPKDETSPRPRFREDTVVRRFVGSAIVDDPEIENACHHGLVDPTINLKEAMDDINNMFGKPIDFVRRRRTTKKLEEKPAGNFAFSILQDDDLEPQRDRAPPKSTNKEPEACGFSILPDDDLEPQQAQLPPKMGKKKARDSELFEQTVFTKEAMDEINKMFGMPL